MHFLVNHKLIEANTNASFDQGTYHLLVVRSLPHPWIARQSLYSQPKGSLYCIQNLTSPESYFREKKLFKKSIQSFKAYTNVDYAGLVVDKRSTLFLGVVNLVIL